MKTSMFQSYQGPTDPMLRSNAVEGYTQVSRIGEQVVNSFVDSYEYGIVPDTFTAQEIKGEVFKDSNGGYKLANGTAPAVDFTPNVVEHKPHFYEWATAYVGMIAVTRKQRSTFRNYVAAETAAPVIVCAAGKGELDELDFQAAGVVRSNSVRTMDDGVGPTTVRFARFLVPAIALLARCPTHPIVCPDSRIPRTNTSRSQSEALRRSSTTRLR